MQAVEEALGGTKCPAARTAPNRLIKARSTALLPRKLSQFEHTRSSSLCGIGRDWTTESPDPAIVTFSSLADTGLMTDPQTTLRGPTLSTGTETDAKSAHPIIVSIMTASNAQVEPNKIAYRLR